MPESVRAARALRLDGVAVGLRCCICEGPHEDLRRVYSISRSKSKLGYIYMRNEDGVATTYPELAGVPITRTPRSAGATLAVRTRNSLYLRSTWWE